LTFTESIDRALAATLYMHRIESQKPAVRTLEDASRRMFAAQAYDSLLAIYQADLSEATQQENDERKAAIILAAIAAALALRRGDLQAGPAPGAHRRARQRRARQAWHRRRSGEHRR
jgi:hypothetical protein